VREVYKTCRLATLSRVLSLLIGARGPTVVLLVAMLLTPELEDV